MSDAREIRGQAASATFLEPADHKKVVWRACRAMLRPIVRLLLKSGVMHREFVQLSKEAYVEVARNEFGLRRRATSISRTALLTGLDRKEVRRVMHCNEGGDPPITQDRVTRVLSGWFQDPDYLDGDGHPLAIPAEGDGGPSFADLKSRYGGDVPYSTILRELLSAGAVERDADGLLRATKRYYMPHPTAVEHMLRAGSVFEDIGTTVVRNLFRAKDDPTWFERRASNATMPESIVPEFQRFIDDEGQRFLERVDEWLNERESRYPRGTEIRVGLGMYIIKGDKPPRD